MLQVWGVSSLDVNFGIGISEARRSLFNQTAQIQCLLAWPCRSLPREDSDGVITPTGREKLKLREPFSHQS